jgi:mono/diheme cytochrome c family protein
MGKRVTAPALAALLAVALATMTAAQMGGGMGRMHGGMGMGHMHGGGMMGMHQPPHPIGVMMNGQMMHFDSPTMMMGGRVMVPMRGVFEHMGARVKWDERTQTVTGTKSGREVRLTVGKPEAVVDGRTVRLETPPQIISESLGADVSWDQSAHQVRIASAAASEAAAADGPAPDPESTVARGEIVYTRNRCDACHTINGEGGTVGPNLSHVGSSLSKAAIEKRVRDGGDGMPAYKGLSQEDLDALADYLGSLK